MEGTVEEGSRMSQRGKWGKEKHSWEQISTQCMSEKSYLLHFDWISEIST